MEEQFAINKLKQGDIGGLEGLVDTYQGRAVQAAYLIVFDRAAAEDVVQAAFIKAAERIHQFDENRPFAPWFYRLVVNDALREANRQKRFVPLAAPAGDGTIDEIARYLVSPEQLPESQVEEGELRSAILDAVRGLRPRQRKMIVMRYFLALSPAEISTRENRPLSTVKWLLHDALVRLRSLLDGKE